MPPSRGENNVRADLFDAGSSARLSVVICTEAAARSPARHAGSVTLLLNLDRNGVVDQAAVAQRMHASGESASTIAATLGVSRATVYRVLAERAEH
jgi:DNA invertase Pin-like site-specific DNA recombinase